MDIQLIDQQINEILNGTRDLPQFNQPEHAGVCSAGPLLVGALLVCNLTRESLSSGCDASGSETTLPNWQIDEAQEEQLQRWAEEKGVWVEQAEAMLGALRWQHELSRMSHELDANTFFIRPRIARIYTEVLLTKQGTLAGNTNYHE